MLVSMKAVLDLADAKKIAVGAFNITSLEGIQAVLGAAEELGQPVILQFAPVHESIIPLKVIGPVMVMWQRNPLCLYASIWTTAISWKSSGKPWKWASPQ